MVASATALALSLAPAHRVIDRVHDHAANVWAAAKPARAPGFPAGNIHMVGVTDLADRGIAFSLLLRISPEASLIDA